MTSANDVAVTGRSRPPSTPEGGRARLGDVQGLRAIAVLLVVVYHAGLPVPGGFVGVDVFFVISGFVITALLVRELRSHGRIRYARFYGRRIKRLLPALSLVLVCTLVASALIQSPLGAQQDTAVAGVGSSLWLANGALYVITGNYFDLAADTIPLLHMWSLAVEEQFYLVLPGLMGLGFHLARRRRRSGLRGAAVAMTIVFVLSFALSWWLSFGHSLPGIAKPTTASFYLAPTRAWEFGAGALLALWVARDGVVSARVGKVASLSGAVVLVLAAVFIRSTMAFPGWAALVPVLGTTLLILGGRGAPNLITGLLETRPMQWLGDRSYSWYLWHWPFIVFAGLVFPTATGVKVVAALLSLVVSAVCYRYVEQPIRQRTFAGRRAIPALALVCVSVPVALSLVLYQGARTSWGDAQISAMAHQVDPVPMGYAAGCHSSLPIPARNLTRCTFGDASGAKRVFLVGDSNAGQYAEALVAAGRQTGDTVVLTTMSGCPFLDIVINQPGVDTSACRAFVQRSTAWFATQAPSTVLLAAANEDITNDQVTLIDPQSGAHSSDPAGKERIWAAGLARTAKTLAASGHHVIIVSVIPHLLSPSGAFWSPAACTMPGLLSDVTSCGTSTTLASANATQARALAAEHTAAVQSKAGVLDLRSAICPDGRCSAYRDGRWVYRDGLHISTVESLDLAGYFARELSGASSG